MGGGFVSFLSSSFSLLLFSFHIVYISLEGEFLPGRGKVRGLPSDGEDFC